MSVFDNPKFFLDLFKKWRTTEEVSPRPDCCVFFADGEPYELNMNHAYRRNTPATFATYIDVRFFIYGVFEFNCSYKVSDTDRGMLPPDDSPFSSVGTLAYSKDYTREQVEHLLMMAVLSGEMVE